MAADHATLGRVIVTAGHCSDGAPSDNTSYYQSTYLFDGIGNGITGTNPAGTRYSDTVLISPTESSTRGLVHTHSGSITLDGKQSIQVVGDTISKSGRTTHDTSGQITHTCVTTGSSTYGTLNCQHYASYNSDGGDSGGAVYGFDIPTGDYKWYGVHWAKFDQGPLTGTTVYSPVSGIEIDQGTLTIN